MPVRPVFAFEELPRSIFLAGPTPRSESVPSWRPGALEELERLGFDGEVFVPEDRTWGQRESYDGQVQWEWAALSRSAAIVFWVPRELETMPAFTTNVEFGMCASGGKMVYGRPDGAPKVGYLDELAKLRGIEIHTSLSAVLAEAVRVCSGLPAAARMR